MAGRGHSCARLTSAFILSIFVLSGCTAVRLAATRFERPVFTYRGSELLESSRKSARVNLLFNAHNPNKAGIRRAFVSFELYVEGKKFLTGADIPFELAPNGDTIIAVPATLDFRDLAPALGSLMERLLSGKTTVPITINAVFTGNPAVLIEDGKEESFSFEKRVTKTAEIPLVKDRTTRGK